MSSREHKNVGKNTEFREKQKAMLTGDYAESTKTTKLEQPSKNVGFLWLLLLRRFFLYQNTSVDTKGQRTNISTKLRDILSMILKSKEIQRFEITRTVIWHHMFSCRWVEFLDNDSAVQELNCYPFTIIGRSVKMKKCLFTRENPLKSCG